MCTSGLPPGIRRRTIDKEINEARHNWNTTTTTANDRSGLKDHVAASGADMPEEDYVNPCRSMVLLFLSKSQGNIYIFKI